MWPGHHEREANQRGEGIGGRDWWVVHARANCQNARTLLSLARSGIPECSFSCLLVVQANRDSGDPWNSNRLDIFDSCMWGLSGFRRDIPPTSRLRRGIPARAGGLMVANAVT